MDEQALAVDSGIGKRHATSEKGEPVPWYDYDGLAIWIEEPKRPSVVPQEMWDTMSNEHKELVLLKRQVRRTYHIQGLDYLFSTPEPQKEYQVV